MKLYKSLILSGLVSCALLATSAYAQSSSTVADTFGEEFNQRIEQLYSKDELIRKDSIREVRLNNVHGEEIYDALIDSLSSPHGSVRREAAIALGQFQIERAIEPLEKATEFNNSGCIVESPDPASIAASSALRKIGTKESLDKFYKLLPRITEILEFPEVHKEESLKAAALVFSDDSDSSLNEGTINQLAKVAKEFPIITKKHSLLALKHIGGEKSEEIITVELKRLSANKEYKKDSSYFNLLSQFKQKAASDNLLEIAKQTRAPHILNLALEALSKMPVELFSSTENHNFIREKLIEGNANAREHAITILGKIGNPEDFELLLDALNNDPSESNHPVAAMALARLKGKRKEALKEIFEQIQKDREYAGDSVRAFSLALPEGIPYLEKILSHKNAYIRNDALAEIRKNMIIEESTFNAIISLLDREQNLGSAYIVAHTLLELFPNKKGDSLDLALIRALKKDADIESTALYSRLSKSKLPEAKALVEKARAGKHAHMYFMDIPNKEVEEIKREIIEEIKQDLKNK